MAGLTVTSRRQRLAPPALTEHLVSSYHVPEERFPDTPEPWSTVGGVRGTVASNSAAAVDFGMARPMRPAEPQNEDVRESYVRQGLAPAAIFVQPSSPVSQGRDSGRVPPKASSKLLAVKNTFIDFGLMSPLLNPRQSRSCPGSRLPTPQSCKSGRLLSPSSHLSDHSSVVSTVDTEDAVNISKLEYASARCTYLPTSDHQPLLDMPLVPPPQQHYDMPLSCQPVPCYDAAMPFGGPPQPFELVPQSFQQHPQRFNWAEASHFPSPPAVPFTNNGTMPWCREQLPTLLMQAPAPPAPAMKQVLQLDQVLPVSAKPLLGSSEMPTVGSAVHGTGECRPCAFFWKPQGCGNGVNCSFCHLCDSGEKKRRAKDKKVALRMIRVGGFM
eukprot:TRINITY_DN3084_c0_g1_i2.p1 TRINITY_DN3084_c0_g1~~TRINITY_DN3084_c0_g1_i2.p1  ORF type:complete len:384 (+),score=71.73 TRINITY_DN3084_c0_g1_i2:83-1234(+)